MIDESLLTQHGELGTFTIRVQQRQNSSLQGKITWMEQHETRAFRSIWEMVKLMDSAIDAVSPTDASQEVTWTDGEEAVAQSQG